MSYVNPAITTNLMGLLAIRSATVDQALGLKYLGRQTQLLTRVYFQRIQQQQEISGEAEKFRYIITQGQVDVAEIKRKIAVGEGDPEELLRQAQLILQAVEIAVDSLNQIAGKESDGQLGL